MRGQGRPGLREATRVVHIPALRTTVLRTDAYGQAPKQYLFSPTSVNVFARIRAFDVRWGELCPDTHQSNEGLRERFWASENGP